MLSWRIFSSFNPLITDQSPEQRHFVIFSQQQAKGYEPMTLPEVKIYSLSTCGHCKATKRLLNDCDVAYDFVDVDLLEGETRAAIIEDVKSLNPRCSFPTIRIGDKVIVGYREDEIKEALGLK